MTRSHNEGPNENTQMRRYEFEKKINFVHQDVMQQTIKIITTLEKRIFDLEYRIAQMEGEV